MEHIEYEERVMISKDDYINVIDDVKKEGKPLICSLIENVYLDNQESFIYKNGRMLRIRTINNKEVELTLKSRNEDGSTKEINETLESHPIIDKELNNRFDDYHPIAKLVIERIEVQYDDYLLVIDKNEYHGITDYDIEIEANSQGYAIDLIKKYCQKYNLKYDENYQVKSHRAIKRAMEIK